MNLSQYVNAAGTLERETVENLNKVLDKTNAAVADILYALTELSVVEKKTFKYYTTIASVRLFWLRHWTGIWLGSKLNVSSGLSMLYAVTERLQSEYPHAGWTSSVDQLAYSGLFHGFLWQSSLNIVQTISFASAAQLCTDAPDWNVFSCWHGVGHAAMVLGLSDDYTSTHESISQIMPFSLNITIMQLRRGEFYAQKTCPQFAHLYCFDGLYHSYFMHNYYLPRPASWTYPCERAFAPRSCFTELFLYGFAQDRWRMQFNEDLQPPPSQCIYERLKHAHTLGCIEAVSTYMYAAFDEVISRQAPTIGRCTYLYAITTDDSNHYLPSGSVIKYFASIGTNETQTRQTTLTTWCNQFLPQLNGKFEYLIACVRGAAMSATPYGHVAKKVMVSRCDELLSASWWNASLRQRSWNICMNVLSSKGSL